jgi:predicted ATP-grasp superfamily ATP-dependent carboligase
VGEETFFATTRFSRYTRHGLVYPSPARTPGRFWAWLQDRLRSHPYDVLFPMDDAVASVVADRLQELSTRVRVPFPDANAYWSLMDKEKATALAARVGMRVPRTESPVTLAEAVTAAARIGYPVVVRPRQGSGGRGFFCARTREQLELAWTRVRSRFGPTLLQEFIPPGAKYDVCVLMNAAAEARAVFVQQELRHFPLESGTSTLQESVPPPAGLVDASIRLLTSLRWCGVAELEFMVDPRDGSHCFLECNPRFWASLQLAIAAGVDFPYLYYQLATEGDCDEVRTYRVGVRCRWLLPGDILHYLANPHRRQLEPPFWRWRQPDTGFDIIASDDPGPVLGFGLASLRYAFSPGMWRLLLRR